MGLLETYKEDLIGSLEHLTDLVEDSKYHQEESVFDHTLMVYENIADLTKQDSLKHYFSQKVGRFQRGDLLEIAALLHDIGKEDTMDVNEHGDTTAHYHQRASADNLGQYVLGFNQEERDYISDVVGNHMRVLHFGLCADEMAKPEKVLAKLENKLGENAIDILVHTIADTQGSVRRSDYQETPISLFGKEYSGVVELAEDLIENWYTPEVVDIRGSASVELVDVSNAYGYELLEDALALRIQLGKAPAFVEAYSGYFPLESLDEDITRIEETGKGKLDINDSCSLYVSSMGSKCKISAKGYNSQIVDKEDFINQLKTARDNYNPSCELQSPSSEGYSFNLI